VRCLSPRTVSFQSDGKTIAWSNKKHSPEYASFQLPCSKCIECRLEYARQWAVRSVHEAMMHESNSFITLTYSDEHLPPKLEYKHFQQFQWSLRDKIFKDTYNQSKSTLSYTQFRKEHKDELEKRRISIFVTGEYGDTYKRPHWHALIFNWRPQDVTYKYTSDRGDRVFSSTTLDNLWGKGITEIGDITFHSAGYCARYAAKKLVHGHDGHQYEPISKKSQRNAIGKRWLEKYHDDIFNYGKVILPDGTQSTIPRYYEKWLQKHHPQKWINYVTRLKAEKILKASEKNLLVEQETLALNNLRPANKGWQISRNSVRKKLIERKFKILQQNLKGDI